MSSVLNRGAHIILVDDDVALLNLAQLQLESVGYTKTTLVSDSRELLLIIREKGADLITIDLNMPFISGEQCLEQIQQEFPEIPVIVISGVNEISTAVRCMRKGAADFLTKPIEEHDFLSSIHRIFKHGSLITEQQNLKRKILDTSLSNPDAFSEIVTNSQQMKSLFLYSEAISETSQPVLITGETGTGKELFAKALHALKGENKPFITVNTAGLDEQLFTDSLFGHTKGAFTGAVSSREGLVEAAKGGTLFLDEIGDLCHASQLKLLRLIQEQEFYPIGSDKPHKADVWIITATHKDIGNSPDFRKDLYYRLMFHMIELPALRDRKDDIPLLIDHFSKEAGRQFTKSKGFQLSRSFVKACVSYHFPGNVRELMGIVYDVISSCSYERVKSILSFSPDDEVSGAIDESTEVHIPIGEIGDTIPTLKEMQETFIKRVLLQLDNNKSRAARVLGITRQTLKKYIYDG